MYVFPRDRCGGHRHGLLRVSQLLATRVPAATPVGFSAHRGLYYGWVIIGALALTETVSYGILSYAFPVFLAPMGAELGWSKTAMTGAFSVAALVSGLAAIPVGRWVDRHGARALMTAGSCLAVLLVIAWATVESLLAYYLIWAGIGLASAAVLYEPAFAVVANWFVRLRGRALTILTFVAGLASVIFVPLATWLVQAHGWREALLWLAGILAVCTIFPHALVLRRRPADLGLVPDGIPRRAPIPDRAHQPEISVSARDAVRSRTFFWLAVAFGFSAFATTAVAVHLIPFLLERGYAAKFAGAAMGMIGLMALPGRLVFTPLGDRWPRAWVTASIFGLQALAVVVLLVSDSPLGVWTFVILFGAGFGAITPARAALMAEFFGPASYGSISGVLSLILSLARALAPVGASVIYAAASGYTAVLGILLIISVGSTLAVLKAGNR